MDCCIWVVIPGHQKCSCNKDKVWSQPWCPASWWHPFRVAIQCTFGTTKSSKSSFLPLGIECRYKAFWWILTFWQFLKTSQPSSLEACSPKSVFRSVFFWASNQSNTVFSTGSSLCVLAQSVMCISTNIHPAVIIPLFPCHSHIQPLQGHNPLPYKWLLGLLHLGWISQPLGWGR